MRAHWGLLSVVGLWAAPLHAVGYLQTGGAGSTAEFLEVTSIHVRVEVEGRIAVTHLDQVFTNRSGRQVEGSCVLDLPEQAFVTGLAVWDGGSRKPTIIVDSGTARSRYESQAGASVAPATLTASSPGQYRLRVFPFPAYGSRRVELEYTEVLEWRDGAVRYRLPLATAAGAGPTIRTLVVAASLRQQHPFEVEVGSRYEPLAQIRQGEGATVELFYADEELAAPADLELALIPSSGTRLPVAMSTAPTATDAGYYAVWVPPPAGLSTAATWPRSVTFVVDLSSSMGGIRLAAVREALAAALEGLDADDLFSLVVFGNGATSFTAMPLAATPANRAAALAFLDGQTAAGASNFEAALQQAFGQPFPDGWVNRVILVTDGAPTVGEADGARLSELAQSAAAGPVSLSAIGIGELADQGLLQQLASLHRGTTAFIGEETDLATQLREWFVSMALPAFIPERMEVTGAGGFDVCTWPGRVLLPGQELFQVGRYQTGGDLTFDLSGPWQGDRITESFPISLAAAILDTTDQAPADTVLFFDDFIDDRGDWQNGPQSEGAWKLDAARGVYVVTVDGPAWAYVRVPAQSYTIETRMRFGSWAGKVIYASAHQNEISRLDLLDNVDYSGVQAARLLWPEGGMDMKPLTVAAGLWHDVRVEVEGGTVTTYVNGVKVHDQVRTPTAVADGYIGIGSYGPTHETEFDYVRVLKGTGGSIYRGYSRAAVTPVAKVWAHRRVQTLVEEGAAGTASGIRELGYTYGLATGQTTLFVSEESVTACLDWLTPAGADLGPDTAIEADVAGSAFPEVPGLRPVLAQNAPNPFNAATLIRCWLPTGAPADEVDLAIYNLAGQRVRVWPANGLQPGENLLRWDGRDDAGHELASGLFVLRLRAGEDTVCRRMALVR
ncbi:MAG: VIT domain-containing protein [Candidatus Latescibacterota bacterium]|jgi:uncharacterized protein YegL